MTNNHQRWVSLGFVGASIAAYAVLLKVWELVWDLARWSYPESFPVSPPELIAMGMAAILFAVLRLTPVINIFMNEAATELAKVSWPTRKESVMSGGVIVVAVAICSLMLVFYDVVWTWSIRLFY